MAEILCPKCGKPNPDFLDNCQFCQTPIQSSEGESYIQPGISPTRMNTNEFEKVQPSDDEPIRPGQAPTKKNTSELERILPSWLRAARGQKEEEPSAEEQPSQESFESFSVEPEPESSEELPDWLAGLDAEAVEDDGEQVPEWLANLRGETGDQSPIGDQPPSDGASFAEEQAAGSEETLAGTETAGSDLPDWLSSLKTESQDFSEEPADDDSGTPVGPEPSLPEGEMPDWLVGLNSEGNTFDETAEPLQEEVDSRSAQPEGEIPDWLAGLKSEGNIIEEAPEPSLGEDELSVDLTSAQSDGEVPDWLAGLKSDGDAFQAEEPSRGDGEPLAEAMPVQFEGEMPDWLAGLKPEEDVSANAPEPLQGDAEPASVLPDGELPDWLAAMKPSDDAQAEVPEMGSDAVPDWLQGIRNPQEISPSDALKEEEEPTSKVPDWLAGGQAESVESDNASSPEQPGLTPSEPVPEWLAGLQVESEQAAKLVSKPAFEYKPSEDQPSEAQPAEAIPDWLEGVTSSESVSGDQPSLIEGDDGLASAGEAKEAFSMDAPDWLSSLEPEQRAAKSSSAFVQDDVPVEALEPGELPSWVQAMRPVESVVGDAKQQEPDEQVVESQGPLAGLSGVLPAGPGLGALRKPPAYSIKLQTNESQQRHAAHLEQMVAAENQATQAGKSAGVFSTRILRWVVSALLLLAVAFPTILGTQSVPGFLGYPSEMGPTVNQIDGLPVNSSVLLIFDYQPAFVGEFHAAAGPLIDYLITIKGSRLAMVSTIPTGPALAEQFMQSTQAEHLYQAGQQYVNLGYISGGTAGVINFIQDPLAAAPALLNEQSVWSLPPLDGVQSLSDFSMLIVLTDNSDTGRVWVEQAAQYMDTISPMIMVVSAQAEPMIRPYYDAGQIQGLVVGLTGGKALEAYVGPRVGRAYWDAFSYGLLVAEILILVGGIWSAISGIRSRSLKLEEDEA